MAKMLRVRVKLCLALVADIQELLLQRTIILQDAVARCAAENSLQNARLDKKLKKLHKVAQSFPAIMQTLSTKVVQQQCCFMSDVSQISPICATDPPKKPREGSN